MKEEVEEDEYRIPLGVGRTLRTGSDLTIVAISGSVPEAVAAADELAKEGLSVEVFDPRTLVPMDVEGIMKSVMKTGRLVVADPAHKTCGAAAEISALVAEYAFESLQAPIKRVVTPDTQIPFSPALEKGLYPNRTSIAAAARSILQVAAPV
jgi:pyruvate dehydrogenase E1 component beta subunit